MRDRTHAYLAVTCKNQEAPFLNIGDVVDHVHILCRLSKVLSIANLIQEVKRESSKWVKKQDPRLRDFYWQSGYDVFSVSPSHVDGLIQYIANQEEHHKHESFQIEFRRLCRKYGVKIDERYIWNERRG